MATRQSATPPRGTARPSLLSVPLPSQPEKAPVAGGLGAWDRPLGPKPVTADAIPPSFPGRRGPTRGCATRHLGPRGPVPPGPSSRLPPPAADPPPTPVPTSSSPEGPLARRPGQGGALAPLGRRPRPRCPLRAELRPLPSSWAEQVFPHAHTRGPRSLAAGTAGSHRPLGQATAPVCSEEKASLHLGRGRAAAHDPETTWTLPGPAPAPSPQEAGRSGLVL